MASSELIFLFTRILPLALHSSIISILVSTIIAHPSTCRFKQLLPLSLSYAAHAVFVLRSLAKLNVAIYNTLKRLTPVLVLVFKVGSTTHSMFYYRYSLAIDSIECLFQAPCNLFCLSGHANPWVFLKCFLRPCMSAKSLDCRNRAASP